MGRFTRRDFIKAGGGAALMLSIGTLSCRPEDSSVETERSAAVPIRYGDWRDLYSDRWQWDRVARGTHTNANCASTCAWNLYVRDGMVWREEQTAAYLASNDSIPDFNPRGCQKGCSFSDLMQGPSRVLHPLQRVGERGSGRWKRVGWSEALDAISREMVDVLSARGGESVVCEQGTGVDFGPMVAGTHRLFRFLGGTVIDNYAQIGDLAFGGTVTLGAQLTDGSSDDWFRSRYLVLWGLNPSATRIPDAHFINEARYAGARVVSISPDYNQSCMHADLWLGIHPCTDAALGMAACEVIVSEGLYDEDYLREQTDLPFLVREDTGRFLRESDLVDGGSDQRFAIWDESGKGLLWAPGSMGSGDRTLELPVGVRPALEVRQDVRLGSGATVAVGTVFTRLRAELRKFTPEIAGPITGIAPSSIRRFAREFARAPSALIIMGYCIGKNYHGDLAQRAQILMASLTGNIGRAGGGWRTLGFALLEGIGLVGGVEDLGIKGLVATGIRSFRDPQALRDEFLGMFTSGTLFHAIHGGLLDLQVSEEYADPALPRKPIEYVKEALAKRHIPIGTAPDAPPPQVLISVGGNILRSGRMGDRIRDTLYANARLVVDINFRRSETSRYADFILPAAGWYEKIGMKYAMTLAPYFTFGDRAVAPLGESKPEWEIYSLMAERIASEARRRGVSVTKGFDGTLRDISRLDTIFSSNGRFGPKAEEEVMDYILTMSAATRGLSVADFRKQGAIRIPTFGRETFAQGVHARYSTNEPLVPMTDFVEDKKPYPTLTGRQQFYIDHPWYLEVGEALPTHKTSPKIGGDHPLAITGGHARWSIHSIWRDHDLMLRLQRGEPMIYLHPQDAAERGIEDHDWVYVWNDVNGFEVRAKLAPSMQPHQVHIFHAWEPYQFRGGKSHQYLFPSPIKVTQLVNDYGQLHWEMVYWDAGQFDRGTRVDVRKI